MLLSGTIILLCLLSLWATASFFFLAYFVLLFLPTISLSFAVCYKLGERNKIDVAAAIASQQAEREGR